VKAKYLWGVSDEAFGQASESLALGRGRTGATLRYALGVVLAALALGPKLLWAVPFEGSATRGATQAASAVKGGLGGEFRQAPIQVLGGASGGVLGDRQGDKSGMIGAFRQAPIQVLGGVSGGVLGDRQGETASGR
jgi:hypothetical protein